MYEQYGMGQYPFPWGGVTPPQNLQPQTPQMQQNQQRTKTIDCMAEVKVLVDSYK